MFEQTKINLVRKERICDRKYGARGTNMDVLHSCQPINTQFSVTLLQVKVL